MQKPYNLLAKLSTSIKARVFILKHYNKLQYLHTIFVMSKDIPVRFYEDQDRKFH